MNLVDYKLCSINRLPPEILEEIFFHCVPPFQSPSYKTAPLVLCLVCSSWYDIGLQSSRLWSNVTIDIMDLVSRIPTAPKENPIFPTIEFLRRSRDYPLSIQLTVSAPSMFDHPEWQPQSDFILGQIHGRIRELRLSSSWLSKNLCMADPNIQLPQLASLSVMSSGKSFDFLPIPLTVFADSTLLKRLDYAACLDLDTALNLDIPWAQLTHITLADVDFDSWSYIFPCCINMQSGTFVISGSSSRSPQPRTKITFTSLTYLAIKNMQSSHTPLILEGFSFPNLQELMLEWDRSPGFDMSFLSTVHHLEKLTISSHVFHLSYVLSVLSLTPFVSHFYLSSDIDHNELFDALTYHAYQQRPLLPHLRLLEVGVPYWNSMYIEEAALDSLRKMLNSRRWIYPNSKVRQLEILRMKHVPLEIQESLQTLTSTGTLLEIYPVVIAATEVKSSSSEFFWLIQGLIFNGPKWIHIYFPWRSLKVIVPGQMEHREGRSSDSWPGIGALRDRTRSVFSSSHFWEHLADSMTSIPLTPKTQVSSYKVLTVHQHGTKFDLYSRSV